MTEAFYTLIDLFQEGKVYSYDDGEKTWIVLDGFDYVKDFMSVFEMHEYGDILITGHFRNDEVYFIQDDVFDFLEFTYEDIYPHIKNSM
jgi:hypothetical protein